MKVDVSQFRTRPTFEDVANIINKDAYKIDLPQRTYIRWDDTHARVQFEDFRDSTSDAEQTRIRRQAVEAQVVPPPTARCRGRGRPPGPDQTILTTGEPAEQPEQPTGKGKKKKLSDDAVKRLSFRDDEDMQDPEAGPSNRPLRASKSDAGRSVPEDTGRSSGPDGRGGGGSAGGSTKVSTHEMQTILRHFSAENSDAHGKLQEALAHHTRAHALGVQTQIEALGMSLAHEARRADAREIMTQEGVKSLKQATANQLATLPRPDPTATQQNLDRMRVEATASTTAVNRQESLLNQIGNALVGE